ncbi:MAG: sulfatase-like hydrolase/transferase [Akkermansiaceae bacterium]
MISQTNEDALTFLKESKDKPFFLYYATWLVHAPIHTRSKARLEKYAKRMGIDPAKTPTKDIPGQQNPFFASMVEELDYYLGTVIAYLENTDDPRCPGHKLSENTYLIFTSDNGGMEGGPKERYTDNNPLDRGKISAKEGSTRVPLIITGPGIPAGVQTEVMVNGLDFYPTILAMTGTPTPDKKNLDGANILPLLKGNPRDPKLVKNPDGSARDTMCLALPTRRRIGKHHPHRRFQAHPKLRLPPESQLSRTGTLSPLRDHGRRAKTGRLRGSQKSRRSPPRKDRRNEPTSHRNPGRNGGQLPLLQPQHRSSPAEQREGFHRAHPPAHRANR